MKYNVGMSSSSSNRKKSGGSKTRKRIKTNTQNFSRPYKSSRSSTATSRTTRSTRRRNGKGYIRLSQFFSRIKPSKANSRTQRSSGYTSSAKRKSVKRERLQTFKKWFIRLFLGGASLGIITIIITVIGVGLYLRNIQDSLPDPQKLVEWSSEESTIIYYADGTEMYNIYDQNTNRQFVSIDEYPDHTKWALLAAEDVEFYQHEGLDWEGLIRCGTLVGLNKVSGGRAGGFCGASTITQQLVKNTILEQVYGAEFAKERSVNRKIIELLVSMQVEKTFTKDEILQLYMNEVPLGGVNYGYGAAAKSYFNKDVKDLTLKESALLAGIIQAPGSYSPLYGIDPEGADGRVTYVLNQMDKYKDLTGATKEQISEAKEAELVYASNQLDIPAYHFVFYVQSLLEEKYGADVVQKGGLRVTTSLDPSTQAILEEEIRNGTAEFGHKWGVFNGAGLVIDPNTGQILAMVGSVDPKNDQDPRIDGSVNVTTRLRQVGSSFKPYVYLTAFQQYGPWLPTYDVQWNFGTYKPTNSDLRFNGIMVAREGLVTSRNLPANYTQELVGSGPIIANAEKMGITTLDPNGNYGLSMALGAAEMKLTEHVHAYTVFATGGIKRDSTAILKVEDYKGNVLEEWKPNEGERIFNENDVYMLNWTLCDLGNFGDQPLSRAPYNYYNINGKRGACGKTGTTNGPKDLVSVQYHKNLVVGIWNGNNNGDEVPGAWSTTVPLPIVNRVMNRLSDRYPSELYTKPADILAARVCEDTGRLAGDDTNCNKISTIYAKGRAPEEDKRKVVKLCKDTNLISTNAALAEEFGLIKNATLLNYEIENKNQIEKFNEIIREFSAGEGNTYYITSEPDSGECKLPLGPNNAPVINITSPTAGASFNAGSTVKIQADARAESAVQYVEFYFDNVLIANSRKTSAPYTFDFKIPDSAISGNHIISAKVVDSKGREGSIAVTISVKKPNSIPTVQISTPAAGSTISSMPVSISAVVANAADYKVIIRVTKDGDNTYVKSYSTDNNQVAQSGFGTWTAAWNDNAATAGTYYIQAFIITADNQTVNSPITSITYNP